MCRYSFRVSMGRGDQDLPVLPSWTVSLLYFSFLIILKIIVEKSPTCFPVHIKVMLPFHQTYSSGKYQGSLGSINIADLFKLDYFSLSEFG